MRTELVDVLEDVDEAKAHTQWFVLWPRQWRRYARSHGWRLEKLEESKKGKIPDGSGIYTLILQPGIAGHDSCSYLMYVGQALSLRRRFSEYLGKERRESGRPKISYFLNRYDGYVWFCYTTVGTRSLDKVEHGLLCAYIPPLNDQFTGRIGKVVRAFS
jgi:hypothetical protein